jgi:hypothetical protein
MDAHYDRSVDVLVTHLTHILFCGWFESRSFGVILGVRGFKFRLSLGTRSAFLQAVDTDGLDLLPTSEARVVCVEVVVVDPLTGGQIFRGCGSHATFLGNELLDMW